ncbi:MAG: outer membrane lipoprotein-sorting protein [Bradymonadaceae bacterium]|nr:outer membrane lipoprotein-sorting protein [Lujinxingiaceae bacterium]
MKTFSMLVFALLASLLVPDNAAALDQAATNALVKDLDQRRSSTGDYKALIFIDQKQKDKSDLVYELAFYRREASDRMVIMFMQPKAEAGKGYLRIDKNLFLYDPAVGRWERRTERERIGGTNSQRADFDGLKLSEEFTAEFVAEEKLGAFTVNHIKLKAKPGVDVAHPILRIWVDKASGNMLKQEEYALSERLMRTVYYPKWQTLRSEEKGTDVHFPAEIRIFDEVEKGNRTTMVFRSIEIGALPDNIFTKAWLESKSR